MKVEDIAKVCHEACRALTSITKYKPPPPGWEFCEEEMRQSCIKGVAMVLANPDVSPQQLHEAWCKERLTNGWRFGEVFEPSLKIHPALRPWEDLPLAQRKTDDLFRAVVKALMPNEEVMREALEAAQAGEASVDEDDDTESGAFRS